MKGRIKRIKGFCLHYPFNDNAINQDIENWWKKIWEKSQKKSLANLDLWKLLNMQEELNWTWEKHLRVINIYKIMKAKEMDMLK